MTAPARFGVDPAELLGAARAAGEIHGQLAAVREALLAVRQDGVHGWAADVRLAAVARRAVDALIAATDVALTRCSALERGLTISAESYARSDEAWPR